MFFLACSLPLISMPFVKSDGEIEKKDLTEMPSVINKGKVNNSFLEEFEAWYNERLPFRSSLLSGANYIKSELLSSPSANVISGKDGWLFYEDTAKDYMDTNAMSLKELKSIVITLSLLQENVKSKNGNFLFVPMPNKNSIYGEYMPNCYKKSDENNLTRLTELLQKSDVNFLDMKQVLTEKKDLGIYHKRDTHWNYLGAMIGYNAMLDKLNKEHKTYNSVSYEKTKNWSGDLDKLLFPNGGFYDEQYHFYIEYDDFRFTFPVGVTDTKSQLESFMSDKEENDNRFTTQKASSADNSKLYMVRDSFGRALLPFLIDNYDTATFVRTNCPNLNLARSGTDMIYEIVERNLSDIISTAPFMEAPKRNIKVSKEKSSKNNKVFFLDEGYGLKIYGVTDEKFTSDDQRVYVRLENSTASYTYEAFPIYEKGLLKNKETASKDGFSLILDTSAIKPGEYEVSIISDSVSSGAIDSVKVEEND